jgi:hypothetical protein
MSDSTSGRGISNDDFDEDEILWDDEQGDEDTDGLSPIEELVAETEDFVGGDEDEVSEDDAEEDERQADS